MFVYTHEFLIILNGFLKSEPISSFKFEVNGAHSTNTQMAILRHTIKV